MSQTEILVLGAIAGLTIFIGLPVGRLGRLPLAASTFLAATATGILLFLLWDVLAAGVEHRGIAFSHQQTRSLGQILAGLLLIWEVYEPEEMANRVEYL